MKVYTKNGRRNDWELIGRRGATTQQIQIKRESIPAGKEGYPKE